MVLLGLAFAAGVFMTVLRGRMGIAIGIEAEDEDEDEDARTCAKCMMDGAVVCLREERGWGVGSIVLDKMEGREVAEICMKAVDV